MPYPTSSDVAAGQPTSYLHYNSLRADAVYLGQLPADATNLLATLARYAHNLKLEPLAANRLRIPYDAFDPCCLVVDGHMCKAAADIDLPALAFSGVAATWYIFANWTAGSTTFSLTANTSLAEAAGQRRIARIDWDGANVVYPSLSCYFDQGRPFTYYAHLTRAAAQSVNHATPTALSFDTEDADTDGLFTIAAPTKITIVHAGLYVITTYALPATAGAYIASSTIRLGGATTLGVNNVAGVAAYAPNPTATAIRYLAAADYIESVVFHNQGGPINFTGNLAVAALSA